MGPTLVRSSELTTQDTKVQKEPSGLIPLCYFVSFVVDEIGRYPGRAGEDARRSILISDDAQAFALQSPL